MILCEREPVASGAKHEKRNQILLFTGFEIGGECFGNHHGNCRNESRKHEFRHGGRWTRNSFRGPVPRHNGLHASMHAAVLFGTLGFVAVCHGFVPSAFTSSLSRHSLAATSSSHSLRSASVKFARERRCSAVQMQAGDELSGMFSGSEQLVFDTKWTDLENIGISGAKATKARNILLLPSPNPFENGNNTSIGFGCRLKKVIRRMPCSEVTPLQESSDMGSRLLRKSMRCTLAS
jgi:hypothetical protein